MRLLSPQYGPPEPLGLEDYACWWLLSSFYSKQGHSLSQISTILSLTTYALIDSPNFTGLKMSVTDFLKIGFYNQTMG